MDSMAMVTLAETVELGRYNAEVARGIVHTDAWRQRMAEVQERYNAGLAVSGRRGEPLTEHPQC